MIDQPLHRTTNASTFDPRPRPVPQGDSWRWTDAETRKRHRWKRESRALILRIVNRLEDVGLRRETIAEVWDQPIGAQWFWGIMNRAQDERALERSPA